MPLPFFGEGSPTKIDYRKKKKQRRKKQDKTGTLLLTSLLKKKNIGHPYSNLKLLEDLVEVGFCREVHYSAWLLGCLTSSPSSALYLFLGRVPLLKSTTERKKQEKKETRQNGYPSSNLSTEKKKHRAPVF